MAGGRKNNCNDINQHQFLVSIISPNKIEVEKKKLNINDLIKNMLSGDKNKKNKESILVADNLVNVSPDITVVFIAEKSGQVNRCY